MNVSHLPLLIGQFSYIAYVLGHISLIVDVLEPKYDMEGEENKVLGFMPVKEEVIKDD
jgi:hypothetical protein